MIAVVIITCAVVVAALLVLVATSGKSTPVIQAEIVEPVSHSFRSGQTRWAYVASRRRIYVRDSALHEDREMLVITGTVDPRRQRDDALTLTAEPVVTVVEDPATRRAIAAYQAASDSSDDRPLLSVYA